MYLEGFTRLVLHRFIPIAMSAILFACNPSVKKAMTNEELLAYCATQAKTTANTDDVDNKMPVVIDSSKTAWTKNDIYNWRSGFWPGIEWYLYESTKDEYWKKAAEKSTEQLIAVIDTTVSNHDLGFQFYCSYGNGYRLTGNPAYKQVLLRAADSLVRLYNPS